jgi:hypothetical protein
MISPALIMLLALADAPDAMANCPMHAQHMAEQAKSHAITDAAHGEAVDHRHDAFGFSHQASRHTFRLYDDGGAIELRASDPADTVTRTAIRTHLKEVAIAFAKGDFQKSQFVHDHEPDGVAVMHERAATISWKYEELPEGARVRIASSDARSLEAIHAFMRFQIAEHRTGDPTTISER